MLLNYTDDGPGPVVVLLHGFPMDHTIWNPQRASIGSTYRLIAPDLRGHGASAAPEGIYSMEDMAGDVHELLDALGIREPIVLGGLSMGGYVAQAFAAQYPDRLRGLVLINTRAGADSEEAAQPGKNRCAGGGVRGRGTGCREHDSEAPVAVHPSAQTEAGPPRPKHDEPNPRAGRRRGSERHGEAARSTGLAPCSQDPSPGAGRRE